MEKAMSGMDHDTFWKLIDRARKAADGNDDDLLSELENSLAQYPPSDILRFDQIYDEYRFKAYRRELWGAAYLMNGGCSDDGFEYFRAWLISRGREAYESALTDPDSLAAYVDRGRDDYELEEMLYVAATAYKDRTGEEMPAQKREFPDLTGKEWQEEELETLYPSLAAKLGQ